MSLKNQNALSNEDYLEKQAINDGIKNLEQESEQAQTRKIKLTTVELQKIQELTSRLRLAKESCLESAINYLHSRFSDSKEDIQKLINEESINYETELRQINSNNLSAKERDQLFTKIRFSPETDKKIEELDMIDKIEQCLYTGINLLYRLLIEPYKAENSENKNGLSRN